MNVHIVYGRAGVLYMCVRKVIYVHKQFYYSKFVVFFLLKSLHINGP